MKGDIRAQIGRVTKAKGFKDARLHCERLTLEATKPGDAQLLAALAYALFPVCPEQVDKEFRTWAMARVSALMDEIKAKEPRP